MLPKHLQKGDTIAIIAPAKKIEKEYIEFAVQIFENWGYKVLISPHCIGENNYFSGTIAERTSDLQWAIDHKEIKAIICARGGYGCIQILDLVNWERFTQHPKWIAGFSDVTIFHQFLTKMEIASIHATMPLNFRQNSTAALSTLRQALEGEAISCEWESSVSNQTGNATGEITGGNLAVLCGLIGTVHQPDFSNKILFLEDVGEALYAIDRSLYQLSLAGVLDQISGLIVGDFSGIKDTSPAYNMSLAEVILPHFKNRSIPISFDFPAGHCDDNRALIFGKKINLVVEENKSTLTTETAESNLKV